MRLLSVLPFFPLVFSAGLALADSPKPEALAEAFELVGIRLLCEQSAPLVARGLPEAQQARVNTIFAADGLCLGLARRVAPKLERAQLQQAEALLDSPLARQFTQAERAVGETGAEGLAAYRLQLRERPPRAERLALVRRLDRAAQTTAMASLLRYEAGKTQLSLALEARGEHLDERALSAQTEAQGKALGTSSAEAVESFMLYAYRQMPSAQLAEYAALYEQEPVSRLLRASVQALPALFAARRAKLTQVAP
ncbi:MAG TPA: hypothetical protein VJA19_13680 [Pseudomonas sp.]|nr:hypothetical protein [Pseudomonas sp.]